MMELDAEGEEFLARYQSEEACINYLVQLKWPNGFNCGRWWLPELLSDEEPTFAPV